MNLIDVAREFQSEELCLAYLEKLRWPIGLACLKCGSVKVKKLNVKAKAGKTRKRGESRWIYQCLEQTCRHQFTATTGTIFHDSHLPLSKWFIALALICQAKKGISANQIKRHLGVQYRTAWYLCHRIRKAMDETNSDLLTGTVEVDETYVGGKYDARRNRGPYEKQSIMGLAQRGGKVEAGLISNRESKVLLGVIRDRVSKRARVITDEFSSYGPLWLSHRRHQRINHIKGEYFRISDIHTNTIENFWSLLKRGIIGSFHKVSVKHLQRYLAEFTYRFNQRKNDGMFALTLHRLLDRIRMPYSELIAERRA